MMGSVINHFTVQTRSQHAVNKGNSPGKPLVSWHSLTRLLSAPGPVRLQLGAGSQEEPSFLPGKQLGNSSYAAMLGQEPRMQHTLKVEKHPAVEMMSIWHPFLLRPWPARPSPAGSCSRNCCDGFRRVWAVYGSGKPPSCKIHAYFGRGESIQDNCHKQLSPPLAPQNHRQQFILETNQCFLKCCFLEVFCRVSKASVMSVLT